MPRKIAPETQLSLASYRESSIVLSQTRHMLPSDAIELSIAAPLPEVTHLNDAELYTQIQAFCLDDPTAFLPFSQRLARDHGWTLAYAQRAIAEYKRFMFLAARAGHPVTPSDQVDQVWHLHLLYTQSYWQEFCQTTLEMPIHHGPTRGGRLESNKFHRGYEQTLESYQNCFGEVPPPDIWPNAAIRFSHDVHFQRVNTDDYWIVPKLRPRLGSVRLPSLRLRQFPKRWLGRSLPLLMVLGLAAGLATGCQAIPATGSAGLSWDSRWLYILIGLGIAAVGTGIGILTQRGEKPSVWIVPWAIVGWLYGGVGLAYLGMGLTTFKGAEFLSAYGIVAIAGLAYDFSVTVGLPSVQWIGQSPPSDHAISWEEFTQRSLSGFAIASWLPYSWLLGLYGLGLIRSVIGLMHGKPIGYLLALSMGLGGYLFFRYSLRQATSTGKFLGLLSLSLLGVAGLGAYLLFKGLGWWLLALILFFVVGSAGNSSSSSGSSGGRYSGGGGGSDGGGGDGGGGDGGGCSGCSGCGGCG